MTIYIGCEAYSSPYPPDDVVYHLIDAEQLSRNRLKTKCGETGIRVYWFIREGSIDDVNCEDCLAEVED
jgi:hypothetical protein